MARQAYNPTESYQSMTTRQLRQLISDKATEAQQRMDTMKDKYKTRAYNDLASEITGRTGKVKRSTSYMTKEEMVEYAYHLRDFNAYDVKSGYHKEREYNQRKSYYENFVKGQVDAGGEAGAYWSRFYNKQTGQVSPEGFAKYKDLINFLNEAKSLEKEFNYEELKRRAEVALGKGQLRFLAGQMERAATLVYREKEKNEKLGLRFDVTPAEFNKALDKIQKITKEESIKTGKSGKKTGNKKKNAQKRKAARKAGRHISGLSSINADISAGSASPTNVKAKQGRKMKESGKVRRSNK